MRRLNKRERGERGAGGGGNSSYGMDGEKYIVVISAACSCFLLWQFLILGGALEQKGSWGGGRAGQRNM